ncbi:RNA polymerase sigma-70 factor [Silvibacterium acidisoli]|uniref:RNA polymerase sigma-70 factor n=1 Tax=Acidobacteriaceae bacterium ZG23-2 TaxID=2883246 RepID=UPI00406BE8B0
MEAHEANTFTEHRQHLFAIAYRMTGSAADAEDLVQEAYLRWRRADPEEIRVPRAFLTTVITRLAIQHLESARVRREEYVGPWLPEPVVTAEHRDPAELSESLTMAFLVLLESLNPVERAVFLLHEVFDYSHPETAALVGKNEEACRQILSRAKQALRQRRPRYEVERSAAEKLTAALYQTMTAGDLEGLMSLLDENVVIYSDGGGLRRAAINPIHGPDRVARFLIGVSRKIDDGLHRYATEINSQIGMLGFRDGVVENAVVLDIANDRIAAIYIVVNPEKLQNLPEERKFHEPHTAS